MRLQTGSVSIERIRGLTKSLLPRALRAAALGQPSEAAAKLEAAAIECEAKGNRHASSQAADLALSFGQNGEFDLTDDKQLVIAATYSVADGLTEAFEALRMDAQEIAQEALDGVLNDALILAGATA